MVSVKKFLVLLRCFHIIICKLFLIKLCSPRGKFSKRDVEGLMGIDPFQLHGVDSRPVPLLLGGKSQGVAARPSLSFGAAKTTGSTASSPAIQREQ